MSENREQETSELPLECPNVDRRMVYIALLVVFGFLIFYIAAETERPIPFVGYVFFIVCAVLIIASFITAGKNAFSLNDDHIEMHNGLKIPYKNIKSVVINAKIAELNFIDNDKNEKYVAITFDEIQKAFREHAREVLTAHLLQHDIILYPDYAARKAAEKK